MEQITVSMRAAHHGPSHHGPSHYGLMALVPIAAGLFLVYVPGIVPLPGTLAAATLSRDFLQVAGFLLIAGSLLWWRSPVRWVVRGVGRRVDAVANLIPNGITGLGNRWLGDEAVGAWLDRRFRTAEDPLLAGKPLAFAKEEWPADKWPTLYMDIPADIRRPVVWDGHTVGGRSADWLAWRQFTLPVVGAAVRAGAKAGIAWAFVVGLSLLVITGYRAAAGGPDAHAYPRWAENAGVWSPLFWWYVERVAGIAWGIGQNLLLTIAASVAAGLGAAYFTAAKMLRLWWEQAILAEQPSAPPGQVIDQGRTEARPGDYLAYVHQAKEAAGRLAGQPVIPVGTATGVLRARGDIGSPVPGQLMALDGESVRQHVLALGVAGSGKTRFLMLPLFREIMTADWGPGHRLGAIVMDGKGTLWRDLMPVVVGRDDVHVIGTASDQKGVDLLAGMTPFEIAATLKAVTVGQVMPGHGAILPGGGAWPETLSLLITHVATLCGALDADVETAERCLSIGFRPLSLVGIHHVAGSSEVQADGIDRLHYLRRAAPEGLTAGLRDALASPDLWASVMWLETDWRQMAHDARATLLASLNVALSPLAAAGNLRERFASGLLRDPVDLSGVLDGGVLMVALGEAEWGVAGGIVNRWIKSRLFALARKKTEANRGRFRDSSLALFADDFQMLATPGPDGDSSFWNIAREAGIFLVAATRSVAALKQVLGEDEARSVLDAIKTTIVFRTQEPETLEHLLKTAGELPTFAAPDRAVKVPGGAQAPGADAAAASSLEPVASRPRLAMDDLLLGGSLALAIVRRAGADRIDIIDLAEEEG